MGEKRIGSNKIAEKTFMENLYTDKTKKLNTSFTTYNKRGYKQITGIYDNGRFRMKNLEKKHTGKRKTKEKKRYNQKTRGKER